MENLAESLAKTLIECGRAKSVRGCTEEEIQVLDKSLGYELPAEYKLLRRTSRF